MGISIIGLGPGDSELMTRSSWEILISADQIYARTSHHPALNDIPSGVEVRTFDSVYDSADSFDEVYEAIAEKLISVAIASDLEVVYAVPGSPSVGETAVAKIVKKARQNGLKVEVHPAVSFIDSSLAALDLDALDGLQVVDALEIVTRDFPTLNCDIPALIGQIHSRLVAGELKLTLFKIYPEDHAVVLVHGTGSGEQVLERLALYEIDRSTSIGIRSSLFVPALGRASSLESFADTVAHLRGPDGCPWDQEQTRATLRKDFQEEFSEVLDALDRDDEADLGEELGDLLFHIVMQVQLATEMEEFTLAEVVGGIEAKIKRRHPHVWGDIVIGDTREVLANWEHLKRSEPSSSERTSILDGLPKVLPALAFAQKMQLRAAGVGFDWKSADGVIEKIAEEIGELAKAEDQDSRISELGDILFSIVNLARWLQIDAESALRETNIRFEERFRTLERLAEKRGIDLESAESATLEQLWSEAKELQSADRDEE